MRKKSMITLLFVALMAVALLAGCSSSGDKNTTSSANDDKTFVVGLDDSFPPMGFRDKENNIVGFDIDLATEAAKRMDMTVKLQVINWDTKELELDNGNIDAIWNGLSVTPERKEAMLMTKPYLKNDQVIVVKKDSPIKAKADLAGKNVGLQKGSSAYDAFKADAINTQVAGMNEYPENVSALQDLGIGRIDAVIVDSVVARYYISSENADYVILGESLSPEEYAVAVKKGNTDLQGKIQKALDDMVADGTAAEISKKWFGENIFYTGN
ncbi:MAG: amino acid ABC transporter substrate-binding protein [Eubacterium sp.]